MKIKIQADLVALSGYHKCNRKYGPGDWNVRVNPMYVEEEPHTTRMEVLEVGWPGKVTGQGLCHAVTQCRLAVSQL